MLPQLKQMMSSMPPDFGEEDFGFGFPFGELSLPPTDLKTETQVRKIHNLKLTMTSPYELASLPVPLLLKKAAYHAKLKNFQPIATEEFKAIQLPTMPFAKENPRKLMISFSRSPLKATLDPP